VCASPSFSLPLPAAGAAFRAAPRRVLPSASRVSGAPRTALVVAAAGNGGGGGGGGAGPLRPYRPKEDAQWRHHLEELRAYKAAHHGDTNVPHVYKANTQLGLWVEKSRRNRDGLSAERVADLDALGFDWAPHETAWETHFQQLAAHGGGAPANTPLSDWATMQRKLKKGGKLSSEREALLNGIGFEWEPTAARWNEQYEALIAFKEANGGSVQVPIYVNNAYIPLGKWLRDQLKRWREGVLEPERVAKLEALGVRKEK
jgi:hypothetical protein